MVRSCVILAVLLIGSVSARAVADEPVRVKPPQQKVLSSEYGRFVFGQISEFRRDQFLLDTKTGRIWLVVASKNDDGSETTVLQPVPFVGADGKRYVDPQ